MAALGVSLPAVSLRGIEINMGSGADGVVRVEHYFDWPLANE